MATNQTTKRRKRRTRRKPVQKGQTSHFSPSSLSGKALSFIGELKRAAVGKNSVFQTRHKIPTGSWATKLILFTIITLVFLSFGLTLTSSFILSARMGVILSSLGISAAVASAVQGLMTAILFIGCLGLEAMIVAWIFAPQEGALTERLVAKLGRAASVCTTIVIADVVCFALSNIPGLELVFQAGQMISLCGGTIYSAFMGKQIWKDMPFRIAAVKSADVQLKMISEEIAIQLLAFQNGIADRKTALTAENIAYDMRRAEMIAYMRSALKGGPKEIIRARAHADVNQMLADMVSVFGEPSKEAKASQSGGDGKANLGDIEIKPGR